VVGFQREAPDVTIRELLKSTVAPCAGAAERNVSPKLRSPAPPHQIRSSLHGTAEIDEAKEVHEAAGVECAFLRSGCRLHQTATQLLQSASRTQKSDSPGAGRRGRGGVGAGDEGAAAVVAASLAADEAALLYPGQLMRQPALLPAQIPLEVEPAQAVVWGFAAVHEHLVVGQGQPYPQRPGECRGSGNPRLV
jgi:hypothetical protein